MYKFDGRMTGYEWEFQNKIWLALFQTADGSHRFLMNNVEYTLKLALWAQPIGQQSRYPVVTTI